MTRSQMQSAVIQSTILVTLNMIISHEIGRNAYDNVWEDPVLKNLTTAFKNIPSNATASSNATALTNSTSSATGSASPLTFLEEPEAFYLSFLPRNVFVYALLCPLSYYWQIYLERFFPTRPRGVEIDYKKKEKVEVDMNEGREEEVVKRWIAQGKVRRSSVSWWNTFVKWVLHVTVGELWISSLGRFVVEFVRWRSLAKVLKNFKSETLLSLFTSFLSIGPLASLIGFVVIPATKRVVFEEGIDTVEAVFFSAFFRLAIPWVVRTKIVQEFMGNFTEGIMKSPAQDGVGGMKGRLTIDEL